MQQEKQIYDPRQILLMGLLGALALSLPFLCHLTYFGRYLMPLFLPVALAGFLLEIKYSLTLCILLPILSFSLNGMPPLWMPPIGIIMMIELALLVLGNHFFYRKCRWNVYVAAWISLIINRLGYLGILYVVADLLKIPKMTFTFQSLVKNWPGYLLLISLVPAIVVALQKNPFFAEMEELGNP